MKGKVEKRTALNSISLSELRRQRKRTGIGSHAIAKHLTSVEGLTPAMIDNWLSGNQAEARSDHFEAVLMAYIKQPDLSPDGTPQSHVAVSDALRAEIRRIHASAPANYLDHAPQKFSAAQMSHLLSGRTKRLSKDMLKFLREEARTLPERALKPPYPLKPDLDPLGPLPERPKRKYASKSQPNGIVYFDITDARHGALHGEIARTRVSPRALLKSAPKPPKGLTVRMVQNWHSGATQSAEKHLWDWVLAAYGALPSA